MHFTRVPLYLLSYDGILSRWRDSNPRWTQGLLLTKQVLSTTKQHRHIMEEKLDRVLLLLDLNQQMFDFESNVSTNFTKYLYQSLSIMSRYPESNRNLVRQGRVITLLYDNCIFLPFFYFSMC